MRFPLSFFAGLGLVFGLSLPAVAQQPSNDGFHRQNGQMHILRNGQLRPMTRDSRLPTGVVVTRDGFLIGTDGTRTALRDGQACDLRGNVVAVEVTPTGGRTLGAPAPAAEGRGVLADLLDRSRGREENRSQYDDRDDNRDDERYDGKKSEKAREERKKDDEKWRESEKKHAEKEYERAKKRAEKRREGKEWDD